MSSRHCLVIGLLVCGGEFYGRLAWEVVWKFAWKFAWSPTALPMMWIKVGAICSLQIRSNKTGKLEINWSAPGYSRLELSGGWIYLGIGVVSALISAWYLSGIWVVSEWSSPQPSYSWFAESIEVTFGKQLWNPFAFPRLPRQTLTVVCYDYLWLFRFPISFDFNFAKFFESPYVGIRLDSGL